MKSDSIWIRTSLALAAGALCLAVAVSTSAQVQTQTTTKTGTTTHEVEVQNGEVVAVEGNHLFVKMADGTLRDFPNVPESAKVNVDGQQLGIHELKPGMKLQHTTVTSTTPQVVTTVETVTGKVWHVTPPLSVILTHGKRAESVIQNSGWAKIHGFRPGNGCLGPEEGNERVRDEDYGDSPDFCIAAHAGDRNNAAGSACIDR